ncbi:molybdenum cofactor guanylyltransferase [Segetibacter sp. 3557_3]|uniref:molybdenum cofactor guanylyltransferase n=1 Tax=Segetibacter sp. 3557_3 TaxID=2547429 RepID=UPI001058B098|nr:molybdenum cofactor guanylyltransferase [Segetibacter sp. 3557_3]TDH27323.1 molybdenum cofactor guanylyltransferase [Segetibacter sp. 3557_3]
MTGLVLCGGQSSRMGTTKGLLMKGSATWAEIAAANLASLGVQVVLSVNDENHHLFAAGHENNLIVTDDNSLHIGGPLKGILSAHIHFPTEDLFVLACDMPDMLPAVLLMLVKEYIAGNSDAYVFIDGQQPEPLCGIYRAGVLARVLARYRSEGLQKHSLRFMLSQVNTRYVPVPESFRKALKNYNSPADLGSL